MLKRHLPIAQPCHEDFGAMHDQGSGKKHCDSCAKSVHNFSDMTEGEARGLLKVHRGGGVCVRYKSNSEGRIMFKRPMVSAPRNGMLAAMTNLMAGVALVALSGCTDAREPDRVMADHCEFDLGPWSYKADRGEGNCPANGDEEYLKGKLESVDTVPCDNPEIEKMGDIGPDIIEPVIAEDPDPVPMMGAAPAFEEEEMGDIDIEAPPPELEDEPTVGVGDIQVVPTEKHATMGKISPDAFDD